MDHQAPSYRTFGYFINEVLADSIEEIFQDINKKIFETEHVELQHLYIDGCEFPYKSRVMGTSEPLKPLKAPYMARNPVKWGFFRLKGQEIPLKI
jgi:hypothetical protein